jgi:hypothetical protein
VARSSGTRIGNGKGHGGPATGLGHGGEKRGPGNGSPIKPFEPGNKLAVGRPNAGEGERAKTELEKAAELKEHLYRLGTGAEREDTQVRASEAYINRVEGMPIARNLVQQLDRHGNPSDPGVVGVMAQAMEKLSTDELKVLINLYRKMGVRLPHEPQMPTIEHEDQDDGE